VELRTRLHQTRNFLTHHRNAIIGSIQPPQDAPESAAATAKVRSRAAAAPPEGDGGKTPEQQLDDIAKWLAGGFALISGLLTFLGIKEGRLDRVLRNEPGAALAAFALIGLAVALGVVVPGIPAGTKVRAGVVASLVGLGFVIAAATFPNLGEPHPAIRGAVIGSLVAATVVVAFFLWPVAVSLKAGSLIVGLILFSAGTYGAFKVSVATEIAKDRPSLTASFAVKDGVPVLTVSVVAAGLRTNEDVSTSIFGYGPPAQVKGDDNCAPGCELITGLRIGGDTTGTVDKTLEIPISMGAYEWIRVRARICQLERLPKDPNRFHDKCKETLGKMAYADVRLPSRATRPQLALSWKEVQDQRATLDVMVSMDDVAGNAEVETRAYAINADGTFSTLATLLSPPDEGGTVSSTLPVGVRRGPTAVCVISSFVTEPFEPPAQPSDCAPPDDSSVADSMPVPFGASEQTPQAA
jgi:hypothetical protein